MRFKNYVKEIKIASSEKFVGNFLRSINWSHPSSRTLLSLLARQSESVRNILKPLAL